MIGIKRTWLTSSFTRRDFATPRKPGPVTGGKLRRPQQRVLRLSLGMTWLVIIGLCFIVTTMARSARADVLIVDTTDADLNDNGGVEDFVPVPADGQPHTVYIWGASTPDEHALLEFNFDLNASGQSVSFTDAVIGLTFSGLNGSLSDPNLVDLQIGWAAFLATPPALADCPTHTLLAALDVTIAPDAVPGPDTTIEIGGPDFRLLASPGGESIAIAA